MMNTTAAVIEGGIREMLAALRSRYPSACNPGGYPCPVCGSPTERTDELSWRCPVCLAGGTALEWIAHRDGVGLRQAARKLAEHMNLPSPSWCDTPAREIGEALERAQAFFLDHTCEAVRKLKARKAPKEAIARGAMGWCPPGRKSVERLDAPGARESGILNSKGLPHLAGRVTIPLHDLEGRLVGFKGWRPGPGRGPKYLDTKATEIYQRNRVVYNLHRAIDAIREKGHGILVEGVFDCWAVVSIGLPNVVAALTCGLSNEQTALLRAVGPRWVVAMDGNEAGRKGAEETSAKLGASAKIVELPDGMDPDDIVRQGEGCLLREKLVFKNQATRTFTVPPPSP